MTRRALAAGLAAAVLAVAACGDDDAGPDPTRPTRPTTTTTHGTTSSTTGPTSSETTAAPEPTDAPTSTSEAAAGQPGCPDSAPVPAGATAVVEELGDVDGDGRADVLRSYLAGDRWTLQVELAAGGSAAVALDVFDTAGVGLVGGADVDGDGRDEVWAQVGSGASTAILGLATLEGCELVQVRTDFGAPAELPVGGSVGAAAGLECRAGDGGADLTVFSVVYVDEDRYEVTAVDHVLDGATLRPTGTTTSQVAVDTARFARATTFTCDDLML